MGYTSISHRLRRAIHSSGLPLKTVADNARVSYHLVYKWATGRQESIPLEVADKLWRSLRGKGLGS